MPTQKDAGKAFEYALITKARDIFSNGFAEVHIQENPSLASALASYDLYPANRQLQYLQASTAAINHIVQLEPHLTHQNELPNNDGIALSLQTDAAGQRGDVRDILIGRPSINWEIGISAKNNHKAVKHSRLSATKDFGEDWLGVHCSQIYFDKIRRVFQLIHDHKANGIATWPQVPDKHQSIYRPVLEAFKEELLRINVAHLEIPQKLIKYLIGQHDFYKVIKRRSHVEVYAFKLHNTLAPGVPRLTLPSTIVAFNFKNNSNDTLELYCNNGWNISFRIHNAETRLIPSLKFDVNLMANPANLYVHHINY